jgi:hypothetical protein
MLSWGHKDLDKKYFNNFQGVPLSFSLCSRATLSIPLQEIAINRWDTSFFRLLHHQLWHDDDDYENDIIIIIINCSYCGWTEELLGRNSSGSVQENRD